MTRHLNKSVSVIWRVSVVVWAWLLAVGGFGLAMISTFGAVRWLGWACVLVGLHIFAVYGCKDVFPLASVWIRHGVSIGSLLAAWLSAVIAIIAFL